MHHAYRCFHCQTLSPEWESPGGARHAAQAAGWLLGYAGDKPQPVPACPACSALLREPAPAPTFFERFVARHWPSLPARQAQAVVAWLWHGWTVAKIGRAGEVDIERGEGLKKERAYVRPDGAFRSA